LSELRILLRAALDLKLLLVLGYPKEGALRFVAQHHGLGERSRLALHRLVHSPAEVEEARRKLARPEELRGQKVVIDGYNVLITVEAGLSSAPLFLCDDGIVRDILAVYGRYRITPRTAEALSLIASFLAETGASEVLFVYDSQVSRSGELAALTRRILAEHGVSGTALTAPRADKCVLLSGGIAASSDIVIVRAAERIVDIPGELARRLGWPLIDVRRELARLFVELGLDKLI